MLIGVYYLLETPFSGRLRSILTPVPLFGTTRENGTGFTQLESCEQPLSCCVAGLEPENMEIRGEVLLVNWPAIVPHPSRYKDMKIGKAFIRFYYELGAASVYEHRSEV